MIQTSALYNWIVNVDLKMWLPRGIFDKEMSQMMFR
nr:unnamed protein product [Callosobruchus chinensis]